MNKNILYYSTILTPFLLIVNLGFGSQTSPILIFGILVNQIVNWVVIICACIVLKYEFKNNVWPLFLFLGLLISKILSNLSYVPAYSIIAYKTLILGMFLVIGTIYIYRHLRLTYKLVIVICLFNVIMMVLQLLNVGDWSQYLSTESTFMYGDKITHDVLFVPIDQLQYSVIQGRPSGLLRSNNILSGVLLFAMALHFSLGINKYKYATVILSAMIVLASAKIVYSGYIIMILILLIKGDGYHRANIRNSLVAILFFLFLYYIFFPGLFVNFWLRDDFFYNFTIRINNIIDHMMPGSTTKAYLENVFRYTSRADWGDDSTILSGYAILIKKIPYIIAFILIMIPSYVKRTIRQREINSDVYWVSILSMIIFLLYPAAVPIFKNQFFWFMGGFALSPYFLRLYIDRLGLK